MPAILCTFINQWAPVSAFPIGANTTEEISSKACGSVIQWMETYRWLNEWTDKWAHAWTNRWKMDGWRYVKLRKCEESWNKRHSDDADCMAKGGEPSDDSRDWRLLPSLLSACRRESPLPSPKSGRTTNDVMTFAATVTGQHVLGWSLRYIR